MQENSNIWQVERDSRFLLSSFRNVFRYKNIVSSLPFTSGGLCGDLGVHGAERRHAGLMLPLHRAEQTLTLTLGNTVTSQDVTWEQMKK